jgi:predicted NAD/FAD-binding protein
MKIAVIGSGVAGNVIANHLQHQHDVQIFEAGSHVGGHSHTHDIELGNRRWSIDTGFIAEFVGRTNPGQSYELLGALRSHRA